MPARSSIFLWLGQNKKFSDQYRLAKQAQIDDLLHEILEIAADNSLNDWVDRQGKDGQTGRVVNRDNILTSQASDRGLKNQHLARLMPKKYCT